MGVGLGQARLPGAAGTRAGTDSEAARAKHNLQLEFRRGDSEPLSRASATVPGARHCGGQAEPQRPAGAAGSARALCRRRAHSLRPERP